MARKPTPAPESKLVPVAAELIEQDAQAANQLAVLHDQQQATVRAVALQMGYQLPADCTDPDLIQRDISANMRRSVEACLEVGKGLLVLKEACQSWNEFLNRLDNLSLEVSVAKRFMQSAKKYSQGATSRLVQAAGTQSKLFEMLVLDDDQIEELELTGQTGELALDDVATMSVKELRAAVREARADKEASDKLLADKNAKIDKLSRHIAKATPDAVLLELQKEATATMNDALGGIRGSLRNALIALMHQCQERGGNDVFMAGLVGQLQAELRTLREEFNLPDVSTAADQELAADVAQWGTAGKGAMN